ncbi:MAG TPA: nuclear transport factor 2 family protein [Nocardioides sp.]|uniref:nuclear transport factor 2 family protein n=1 Tax=Nocardioides sp. TaxID=35761 RepID=UPI002BE2A82F|nr:nuclear transport factor 2 family protein [Nocardioides sp.]HTW18326.1 nuclear transport factor 2 family protein [Nocardioides sp.]
MAPGLDPAHDKSRRERDVRDVLAAQAAWTDAIVADDADRMATHVTDDWVIVSASGVSLGTQLLTLVASGELSHSAMAPVGEPRVRILGDTALVTVRATNTAHFRGRRHDADEWTTDVFVRREDRWLCTLTHYTPAAPS